MLLQDTMGLEISALPTNDHQEIWVLKNQLQIEEQFVDAQDAEELGLAVSVLALLQFSGGRVREHQVFGVLGEHLGIPSAQHADRIKTLVQHKYISAITVQGDPPTTEYEPGFSL
jgi:hypothetical protein